MFSSSILKVIGCLSLALAIYGLVSGKVVAGSRGFKTNYYYKGEQPGLYYFFIVFWFAVGGVVLVFG